jgi:hypothetical protein
MSSSLISPAEFAAVLDDDPASTATPLLTVIIPAYNEERTIGELLRRVLAAPYDKQVIVVDDGSADSTGEILDAWTGDRRVEIYRHPSNRGKGAAIRTGLTHARGEYCLVQDADLEYDPNEYERLIEPLRAGQAVVVYGSRYLHGAQEGWRLFRYGVSALNVAVRLLYGVRLTDEATCYKAMPTSLLRRLDLQCERFEFCPEVTAKLCQMRLPILEVPITYHARSALEGKKIRWSDGWQAFQTLWRWRTWQGSWSPTKAPIETASPPLRPR